jgi:hypothetical protein
MSGLHLEITGQRNAVKVLKVRPVERKASTCVRQSIKGAIE